MTLGRRVRLDGGYRAAADGVFMAGQHRCPIRKEECHEVRDLLWLRRPAKREAPERVHQLGQGGLPIATKPAGDALYQRFRRTRPYEARRDADDADYAIDGAEPRRLRDRDDPLGTRYVSGDEPDAVVKVIRS